jgi:hypothetical protein
MPRYFLHIICPHRGRIEDREGAHFSSESEALREAVGLARQLSEEATMRGQPVADQFIELTEASGVLKAQIAFDGLKDALGGHISYRHKKTRPIKIRNGT